MANRKTKKPMAIICDLDGTLAHAVDRNIFDYGRVGEDIPDMAVWDILVKYDHYCSAVNDFVDIILVSGRDEICRPETETWLNLLDIPWDALYMRPKGDKRKDAIVKRELYDAYIEPKYDILFVLEDRNQMVKMWRDLGIKCLQVADGDF